MPHHFSSHRLSVLNMIESVFVALFALCKAHNHELFYCVLLLFSIDLFAVVPRVNGLKTTMPYFPAYFLFVSECVCACSVCTSHKRAGAQLIFINMYFRVHMCAVRRMPKVFYLFIWLC